MEPPALGGLTAAPVSSTTLLPVVQRNCKSGASGSGTTRNTNQVLTPVAPGETLIFSTITCVPSGVTVSA